MSLINTSVKRPVGVIIIVIAVMLLGVVSLRGLAVDLLPKLELPVAVVMTSYNGAGPEEVEKLVTKPLERSLSTIEGLDTIQSISAPNQSVIVLMFNFGIDIDSTLLDMRDKVDAVRSFMPDDAEDPAMLKFDPNSFPIMQLSLSGDVDQVRLTQVAEEMIQPRIERIPGVAQVNITGSKTREIRVEVDPTKLNGYGLAIGQIVQMISGENMSVSAGSLTRGSQDMLLRVTGEFQNADEISNINLPLSTGQTIKLSEIADVKDTFKEQRTYTLVNGEPALGLDIFKQTDGNTVKVASLVQKEMENLKSDLPAGIQLNTVMDTSFFIKQSINRVVTNMLLGSIFSILVLYLFLRNIRSTIVIGVSIPIALISTFTMIYFTGETINILSMGGLALGIGMMVDSSIVVLENIYRYREQGYGLIEAAKMGATEVQGAVIASVLTNVMVFAPIVFTQGIASEIFRPLALTVTFSLLASLAVSITLIPMLSSRLLVGVKREKQKGFQRISEAFGRGLSHLIMYYERLLKWAIIHKKTVVFGFLALLVASFALVPLVDMEFIPAFDQGELMISVTMPVGYQLEKTKEVISDLEGFLLKIPGVDYIFSTVGGSGMANDPTRNSPNIGNIYVRLVPSGERDITTSQVIERINEYGLKIPDADINASSLQSSNMSGSPISIDITGEDLRILKSLSEQVETIVSSVPGTTNVSSSLGEARPELQVVINRDIITKYGLTFNSVMQTVRTGFNGQVATRMKVDGEEIDVNVILPEENRRDINSIKNLTIMTPMGINIPLSAVADFEVVDGPSTINRQNQERGVSVTGDIINRNLSSVTKDIRKELDQMMLPEGYGITIGGQNQEMMESFSDLSLALLLAIFLVYAVMAVQFESALYPFIIMFSMPATFIGVVLGLVLTGRPLSVPAFIGIIMLAGIVVNNAIVLVDYVNTLRGRGLSMESAILQAGPQRLRPILMTTLTTILGMMPLAIGIGEGSEVQAPLATVIVFGLSFSTLVTLVLVPVMYIYLDRFGHWLKNIFIKNNRDDDIQDKHVQHLEGGGFR
ncbi:efflux RND transporter permease subunit [Microaerobacter geothermalis]|uniref:efflux RND transporter permease subunit n=1 Tax=Microaerobacter geothermalis TaxID=674972 RepID=UPI001F1D3198|nr:efflux RND transporter permease subunit [Microaerobacter geothermalis]MCF6093631.1 efflux RND transporter permease subunit [Microaerobacter geothermalis]